MSLKDQLVGKLRQTVPASTACGVF